MQDGVAAEWLVDRLIEAFRSLYAALGGALIEHRHGCRFLLCPSVPITLFNGVWGIEKHSDDAVEDLARAMADVERQHLPFGVLVREDRAPALESRARRLGLTAIERLPAMVASPDELHDRGHGDLEIVQVRDPAHLERALSVASSGFEAPVGLLRSIYQPAVADLSGVAFYVALFHDEPVSTATGLLSGGGVGVFNVATPPAHRGRGYAAAVTARAAQDGFRAGAVMAWLQSSHLGEPVYRRLGFRQVDTHLLLTRPED